MVSPSDSAQWRLFVKHEEIIKLQKYLQQKFGNRTIDVRPRPKQDDSVELYLGDEFIGLIYLERLKRRVNSVCLTSNNFQRLFLVAVMTAAKFLDDFYYSNKHWAEVGGIPNKELNYLETEFLFRLSFSLYITREEYDAYTSLFSGACDEPSRPQAANPALKRVAGMGEKIPSYQDVTAGSTAF